MSIGLRSSVRVVLAALVLVASGASVVSTRVTHATAVLSGLPTHFGFGLAAHPDSSGLYGWMPNSGIPWDYAYQYLVGGVNTGSGWETWNSQGQFPLSYAQGADANHYIPVFPYYEMLQSNGSCNSCGEPQRDLSNLNNTSTMNSYFVNFRLLMQRLGSGTYNGIAGFGKTAIVHVEPDLSAYAEQAVLNSGVCYGFCSGTGNNPALLHAAVASSGVSDVAAYPNTYQGFNWALLHLRDLYAPNVQLAFHVSDFATGTDIGSNPSSSLDATALGQEAGSFAAQSGITGLPSGVTGYNLIFNDVADRDAAYYKYVYNDPSRFWDRNNVTFPNFKRWEAYVAAIHTASGRSVMVWQVPEGNQYFNTVNNTDGHYQDNRAEYFFGHIAELASAGIIGVLFGAGNGGSTSNADAMGDGTTNPSSFCSTDGLSSGQICNSHPSSVSDDDGGYIRMQAQQYYASLGSQPTPTATRTATATQTATRTATATQIATRTATPLQSASSTPASTAIATNTPSVTRTPTAGTTTTRTATATRTAVPPSATGTATATATPAAGGTLGYATTTGGQFDTGNNNNLSAVRVTTGAGGAAVSALSVYVGAIDTGQPAYGLAIYTNSGGVPYGLVASASGTLVHSGWNTLPIAASLAPNTTYWLVYNSATTNASLDTVYFVPGVVGIAGWSSTVACCAFPATQSGWTASDTQYAIYATLVR